MISSHRMDTLTTAIITYLLKYVQVSRTGHHIKPLKTQARLLSHVPIVKPQDPYSSFHKRIDLLTKTTRMSHVFDHY